MRNPQRLYAMRDLVTGYTKIGISHDPTQRALNLSGVLKSTVEVIFHEAVEDARRSELVVHYLLRSKRVMGEWFNLSKEEIASLPELFEFARSQRKVEWIELWHEIRMGRNIAPIHPGEILKEDFLDPMGVSAYRLAKETHVPEDRVSKIIRGKRDITADTALRFGLYFGVEPQFWLNLQSRYDLDVAEDASREQLEQEIRPLQVA